MNIATIQSYIHSIPLEHRWLQSHGCVNVDQLRNDVFHVLVACGIPPESAVLYADQVVFDTNDLVADLQGQDIFHTGFTTTPYLIYAEIERFLRRHVTTKVCRVVQMHAQSVAV